MLRGVNRKIIEVQDPESRYFERAILFVRQGDWSSGEIEREAAAFLKGASAEAERRERSAGGTLLKERRPPKAALFKGAAAVGAAVLLLLLLF